MSRLIVSRVSDAASRRSTLPRGKPAETSLTPATGVASARRQAAGAVVVAAVGAVMPLYLLAMATGSEFGRNARIGRAIEDVIISLLKTGRRAPTDATIHRLARDHPVGREGRASFRAANVQRICAGVMSFFAFHTPPEHWRLIGSRVHFEGGEFDLVWQRPDGMIVVDEIKSGRLMRPLMVRRLRDQLERELAAGRRLYGDRFHGARLLWLGTPRHSLFAPAAANAGEEAVA